MADSKREGMQQMAQLAGMWLDIDDLRSQVDAKVEEIDYEYGYVVGDAGKDLHAAFNAFLDAILYVQTGISDRIGE